MADPIKLQFAAGINRESTDYGNTGGMYDCNLARTRARNWCSMGGWQKFTAEAMLGVARSLFAWSTLDSNWYHSTGTHLKYYLLHGITPVDITPLRDTVTLGADPFATLDGSTTVTVSDTAHGAVLNDFVTFSGATGPVGGVPADDLNQEHQITSIIDADSYTIEVSTAATSSASGGGASVQAEYQINVGLASGAYGNGWGTGPWGSSGWGEGSDTFVLTDTLRLWSEDNFGEDLLFNVRDGGIYFKDMSGSLATRAVELASLSSTGNIPTVARQILVSDNDRHVIAFGVNTIGTAVQDPLLARWSAAEDKTDWTPNTTNTSGSLRFDGGSQFMRAIETMTETLVFTDATLHSMRFVGPPFTFGQTRIGTNIKLVSPNAVVSDGSVTYWMADGKFQLYDGAVRDIPCDIQSYLFGTTDQAGILNTERLDKVTAGVNNRYGEIWWHVPVNGSEEINFYVVYNYRDQCWYYGSFNGVGRTTWIDAHATTTPLASAVDGYVYQHDIGALDRSVAPAVMLDSYVQSSPFELGAGGDVMLVSRTIPDVDFSGSSAAYPKVNLTFETRDYPGSGYESAGSGDVTRTVELPVEEYTAKIDKRWRGRSTRFKISTANAGTLWKLGVTRMFAAPDGRR